MKKNIIHYGDLIAVPFFILMIYYFINKKNRTIIENLLLMFSIGGFIADLYFSYKFLNSI